MQRTKHFCMYYTKIRVESKIDEKKATKIRSTNDKIVFMTAITKGMPSLIDVYLGSHHNVQ